MSITYIIISIIMLLTIAALTHRTFQLRRTSQLSGVYNFELQAQRILDRVCEETGFANGILLAIHNSGGEMVVGAPLYSTVITEANDREPITARKKWVKMPLDSHYWELQAKVRSQKKVKLRTEDLPLGSKLRGVYEIGEVNGGMVFEVYDVLRTRYFYASFLCTTNIDLIVTPAVLAKLTYAVNELRLLCIKSHRQGYIK